MHRAHHFAWVLLLSGCGSRAAPAAPVQVAPGIDVLLSDSLHLVTGRRVGLLTNQTGVDRNGVKDLRRLLDAGVQVTALFSPEHGYRGILDQELVEHGIDSVTSTRIWSLYGNVRAPTPEMLQNVDVVVCDLQDIGARPYTFISTVLLAMRSAQRQGVEIIVLDRPNPIGGTQVQGPILDTVSSSFVGMLPVPLRHGMTLGELARLGNDALRIGAGLTVVPAAGWRREQWLDGTGLPWVRPSPNMPNLESATHYPGTVLFEATNLSVGRGTPIAFQAIGAPWLDPGAVARLMGAVPGATVGDTVVTPVEPPDNKYSGVAIPMVRLRVVDRAVYDPTLTAVRLWAAIRAVHRDSLRVNSRVLDQRAGSAALREALDAGRSPDQIWRTWQPALEEFRRLRQRYLLYR